MSASLIPARVPAPGRIIRRELEARGWTQKDLAHIMDRPEQAISQIVRGRKRVTPETALELASAFGTSADVWLNLEANYQLHRARQEQDNPDISRRSRLYELVPLTEILRRGWIPYCDSLDELEQAVCAFLEIPTPADRPQLAVSFRQSRIGDPEIAAEIAWAKRVNHLARAQRVGDFSHERLRSAIPELLTYTAKAMDTNRIPTFLHSLGVRFVIVPQLSQTYLDGAAFITNGRPVVALTLRYDRIDSFWFTLLHELAHVVAGHKGVYLDNLDDKVEDESEDEANRLAGDWLIDPEALREFVAATQPYFSEEKIRAFARSQGCHPGIVLGRLQYADLVPYKNLRKLLVPVEKHLRSWIDVAEPGAGQETQALSGIYHRARDGASVVAPSQ